MPDKQVNMQRSWRSNGDGPGRPIMLAIAGDSAAGKTTITKGLVEALASVLNTTSRVLERLARRFLLALLFADGPASDVVQEVRISGHEGSSSLPVTRAAWFDCGE